MERIIITKQKTHLQVEWPDGSTHTWKPIVGESNNKWHCLVNRIADAIPLFYSRPASCSGAGDLQCDPADASLRDIEKEFGVEVQRCDGFWCVYRDRVLISWSTDLTSLVDDLKSVSK